MDQLTERTIAALQIEHSQHERVIEELRKAQGTIEESIARLRKVSQ